MASNPGKEWPCPKCTFINAGGGRCQACGGRRPASTEDSSARPHSGRSHRGGHGRGHGHRGGGHRGGHRGGDRQTQGEGDRHEERHDSGRYRGHGGRHEGGRDRWHGDGQRDHSPYGAVGGDTGDDGRTSLSKDELRLVLLGHTGCGKSATGNCILDQKVFESMASAKGVTALTKQGTARRFNRTLYVVDTPGLFDPCMTNEKVITEITKCFGMTAPGPHAFILVVHIGRFTQEEKNTVEEFKKYFGPFMMKYLLVLFTRTDDLEGRTLRDYVGNVPKDLEQLLQSCSHRYIGFNNKASAGEKEQQVQQLLQMVDDMVRKNGGTCYTNEMYQEAEKAMRRREKDLRQKMERKKRHEIGRIEMENAKKLSQMEEKYKSKLHGMQAKMEQMQISQPRRGEGNELSGEVKALKEQLAKMNKEKEEEEKQRLKENVRKVEELQEKYKRLEDTTRNMARKEVEEEEKDTLGLVWEGVKKFGKGIFQGIKSIFK